MILYFIKSKSNLYRLILIVNSLFFSIILPAQTIDSTAYSKYTFIKPTLNRIENDTNKMQSFYQKLYQLSQTKRGKISIVHIGDSHLQADIFSGSVRQKMQLKFGNAGRGLIFPYRVAKSNEPSSYRTTSNISWDSKRNVFLDKPLPIGISGFTIESPDTSATINIIIKDQPRLGYGFTKFTLYHDKGSSNYDITICDEYKCEQGVFKSDTLSTNPFMSTLKFNVPIRQFILNNKSSDSLNQKTTRIYGMLLENDSAGILYNMIGVNGAEYRHYNMSKYFMQQLPSLNPDLVIVSLGTNESFSTGFNKEDFAKNIDTLITHIQQVSPNTAILITTPPDSYILAHKKRIKNSNLKIVRAIIINYCNQHSIAYWDWYEIMGGYGTMMKWYQMQLAQKDKVHFTAKGYQIQGDLLYRALIEGYENYVKIIQQH
ncbi:MAG: SGNH/GDSL hydrolase family protein [Bacteroidia bacterium]